jgi:orotate phosphoribosyltransferase
MKPIWSYRSVADLWTDVRKLSSCLPRDIELIVGIPRSGLLPASMLALLRNLPLAEPDGVLENRLLASGPRYAESSAADILAKPTRMLVVDDSVRIGAQMTKVRQQLMPLTARHRVEFAAIYVRPGSEHYVDHFVERVGMPRFFEWNLLHHSCLECACADIDGLLCRDPSDEENDDGRAYLDFIARAEPKFIPTKPVGWLVTCRLEKYRKQTERWLKDNGVQYGSLIMMQYSSARERAVANAYGSFKAAAYGSVAANLFLESSAAQANEIAEQSGKAVFCTETWQLIQPGRKSAPTEGSGRILGEADSGIKRLASAFFRRMWRLRQGIK